MGKKGALYLFIIILFPLTFGCDGGGENEWSCTDYYMCGEAISGFWKGTVTDSYGAQDVWGFTVDENYDGRASLVLWNSAFGSISVDSSGDFTGSLATYSLIDGRLLNLYFGDGFLNEKESIKAEFILSVPDNIWYFDLVFDDSYDRPSSLELIKGDWEYIDDVNYILSMSIDSYGNIEGIDTNNCNYDGKIELIDSRYNIYIFKLYINGCYSPIISTSGYAIIKDTYAESDTLEYFTLGRQGVSYMFAETLMRK